MPLPAIGTAIWYALVGSGVIGGSALLLDKAEGIIKAGSDPFKKAIKIGGLGVGAFYAQKVAKNTQSKALRGAAHAATIGAVAIIGKEALFSDKPPKETPSNDETEAAWYEFWEK